jgi:hypothetical protein
MKFRKKPVVVEAMQFTEESKNQCFHFVTCNRAANFDLNGKPVLAIQTLEGVMTASLGDWIIKGMAGEFYPCKPEIFDATYDAVVDSNTDDGYTHMKTLDVYVRLFDRASEVASIFQVGGEWHERAALPLGGSTIVDGLAWAIAEIKRLDKAAGSQQ